MAHVEDVSKRYPLITQGESGPLHLLQEPILKVWKPVAHVAAVQLNKVGQVNLQAVHEPATTVSPIDS